MWKAERALRAYEKLRREMGEDGAKRAIERAQKELEKETGRPASWEDAILHLAEELHLVEEPTRALVVNLPPERVYHPLLDYLTNNPNLKDMKIRVVHCSEPSYIEIKFGSWYTWAGVAKINIRSKDGKSQVDINFNFKKNLVELGSIGAFAIALSWIFLGGPLALFLTLDTLLGVFVIGFAGVTTTTKRITDRINIFIDAMERLQAHQVK